MCNVLDLVANEQALALPLGESERPPSGALNLPAHQTAESVQPSGLAVTSQQP